MNSKKDAQRLEREQRFLNRQNKTKENLNNTEPTTKKTSKNTLNKSTPVATSSSNLNKERSTEIQNSSDSVNIEESFHSPLNNLIFENLSFRNLHLEELIQENLQSFVNNSNVSLNNSNMAKSSFSPSDKVFGALGSPDRAHLNAYLAQQVANAGRVVRVSNINTSVDLPKYDHRRMTSDTFFQQCQNYLNAQEYEEANHYKMLPIIFKGEMKLWYDSVSSNISDWDDFKTEFSRKFDSNLIQRERNRILHSKRQTMLDPSEEFVYQSYNLAKQVDPTEDDRVTLERIRDSLFPEICALVGDIHPWNLNTLLDKVAHAHSLIDKRFQRNKYQEPRHPPLKGLREDLVKLQQRQNDNLRASSSRGRGNFRGSFNQIRNNYGNRQYDPTVPQFPNLTNDWSLSVQSNPSRGSGNFNYRGRNSHSNYRGSSYRPQSNFRGQNRGRGNSQSNGNSNNGLANNQCRKCLRYGHFARECPNQVQGQGGVAMLGQHQNSFIPWNPSSSNSYNQNPSDIPLNYPRESHVNSNRGYSRP